MTYIRSWSIIRSYVPNTSNSELIINNSFVVDYSFDDIGIRLKRNKFGTVNIGLTTQDEKVTYPICH